MLEIILIFFLCRWCYRKAKSKGYSGGLFAFLGAALWIGMEIIGFVVGVVIMVNSNTDYLTAYFFALAGAIVGALITLFIVRNLRVKPASAGPVRSAGAVGADKIVAAHKQAYCRRCGSPIPEGGTNCEKCGEPAARP